MTNGCVAACRLHARTSADVCECVCACVRTHSAACLDVFACLSHDVLWQLLTNHTGASGRWGVGVTDRHEKMRSREEELLRQGGGTQADCCHMMGI